MNSPLGIALVSGLFATFCTWLFKRVPAAEKLFNSAARPIFFDAVRWAEKQIPDGSQDVATRRLDEALKFVATLDPNIMLLHTENIVAKAITMAHDDRREVK